MKSRIQEPKVSRRKFLSSGVRSASLVAAGTAMATGAAHRAKAAASNPYEYKVDHLFKTDPKLIGYEQAGKFVTPEKDPRRIFVGPDDTVYLAAGNLLVLSSKEGARRNELKFAEPVRAVTIAADGTLYVALRGKVQTFDRKLEKAAEWDAPLKKAWFAGLAVGENDVFIGDAGNRVVWRYDRSGKLTGRLGEKNAARNIPGLICPSPFLDVELAKDGLLRVTNPGRHQVEAYTFDGDLELSWGKPSFGIEGFCGCCNPINIALLADGRFVTCEKGIPRVKVYSERGVFECVVAGAETFPESLRSGRGLSKADGSMAGLDAAVDSQGRVYVLDQVAGEVRVMVPKPAAGKPA